MISLLVKLMPIPATKTFVITLYSPRLTPAKLSLQMKQRKQQNRQKKPLLSAALVTGSY
jgi:hypothetical protein